MKEQEYQDETPGEFKNLSALLRATDHSGKSKVRDSLKDRLLNRPAKEETTTSIRWAWLFPAAAAAVAALGISVFLPHRRAAAPDYSAAYATNADAYGECGRQGLKDYLSGPRF